MQNIIVITSRDIAHLLKPRLAHSRITSVCIRECSHTLLVSFTKFPTDNFFFWACLLSNNLSSSINLLQTFVSPKCRLYLIPEKIKIKEMMMKVVLDWLASCHKLHSACISTTSGLIFTN